MLRRNLIAFSVVIVYCAEGQTGLQKIDNNGSRRVQDILVFSCLALSGCMFPARQLIGFVVGESRMVFTAAM